MEGQVAKRRRVYSVEPNQIAQSIFTRNYLNHLVPALVKIKEKSSSIEDNSHCDINNAVKYEVDMAMVLSAQGFAWSKGLKVKLQSDHVNAAKSTTFLENVAGEGSSKIYNKNDGVPNFSLKPSSRSHVEVFGSKSKCMDKPEMKRDLSREDDEDEDMNNQWKRLRRLIPGGEAMCDEQMTTELESYICCLQMQVNALQFLLPETS
ncbi:hypothetical protein Fmac_013105 [Flemingia macrophylla]|uniref:IBH1-like N-terminal domain-containing protein n=1 Tax=Flemingia macrophylla TaxID=520843 RepID=A0ABD1MS70_9FABA